MIEEIIDGVNVAGCKFLEEAVRYNNNAVCSCTDVRDCEGDLFIECCGEKPNCYYKQLKRLEQENKINLSRAKDLNTELQRLTDENFNLKQTLEEIREKAQHCIRQDVCALCDYSEECAVPDADGLVYDNNRLLIKLINDVLNP